MRVFGKGIAESLFIIWEEIFLISLLFRRLTVILMVLSLLFAYTPDSSNHFEVNASNSAINANSYMSACHSSEELFFTFDTDVNAMQLYTDSKILLDFDILGIDGTESYTPAITSSLSVSDNITEETVYTSTNNHAYIQMEIVEEPIQQTLDQYIIEHVIIDFLDSEGTSARRICISLLNTQYGVFVSYVDDECLIDAFAKWLCDNQYISGSDYIQYVNDKHSSESISGASPVLAMSTKATVYEESAVYVTYTISGSNSGAALGISGYVYWTDTGGNRHPARNISLSIIDDDLIDETLATITTNSNGYYYTSIANQTGIFENGCDIRIYVYAKNQYANVADITGAVYSFVVDCGDDIIGYTSGSSIKSESNASKAFSVADAVYTGGCYVKAMSTSDLSTITVKYPYSGLLTSHYNNVIPEINLTSEFFSDWDVILHEYGHYASDIFGIYPFTAMAHDIEMNHITYINENELWNVASNAFTGVKYDGCALAWQEGWATYFSISAQVHQNVRSMGIPYTNNIGYSGYNLETNTDTNGVLVKPGKGEASELAVARVLWDLADVAGSTFGASDNDLINWGFSVLWLYTVNSEAINLSQFMSYMYEQYIGIETVYSKWGYILEDQKVSAIITSASFSSYSATIQWAEAYHDDYVQNSYYLVVFNSDMELIYSHSVTVAPAVIHGDTWTSMCNANPDGMYFSIKTVPAALDYATGPYYSHYEFYNPNA